MNKQVEFVEQYLNEVREHLGVLPDRDQIIDELRSHIWDLANRLSVEKGLTVQEAFNHAIMRMEDPEVLASKFLDEEPVSTISDWRAPITTPESKVKNEQFLLIAFIGIISVIIMTLIISVTEQLRLNGDSGSILSSAFVLLTSLVFGAAAITMFIVVLYFYDEKLFRKQIENFRRIFLKPSEEKPTPKTASKHFTKSNTGTLEKAEPSFWGAFGEHLGGLLGGFFITFLMAFIFLAEQLPLFNFPLFNEHWYSIGALATYVALGSSLAYCVFLVVFGRIRATRLASATKNIIGFACAAILVWYYPFTLELAILAQNIPEVMSNQDLLFLIGKADLFLQFIIGTSGIISGISALYDMFKFGAWKPSDRKSLI